MKKILIKQNLKEVTKNWAVHIYVPDYKFDLHLISVNKLFKQCTQIVNSIM